MIVGVGKEEAILFAAVLLAEALLGIVEGQVEDALQQLVGLFEGDGVIAGHGARRAAGCQSLVDDVAPAVLLAEQL